MTAEFLRSHFKWHKKLKMKTEKDYPVTITKEHHYHISDGIMGVDVFSEDDVASYCNRKGFKFGRAKNKNEF